MPLTRRIQVFISEEASKALDDMVADGVSQTQVIERALLAAAKLRRAFAAEQILAECSAHHLSGCQICKPDSQPDSSSDTKPRSKTAEELGLKPCLMHHIIGCQRCANCTHPAKARRGKKCLECGGTV